MITLRIKVLWILDAVYTITGLGQCAFVAIAFLGGVDERSFSSVNDGGVERVCGLLFFIAITCMWNALALGALSFFPRALGSVLSGVVSLRLQCVSFRSSLSSTTSFSVGEDFGSGLVLVFSPLAIVFQRRRVGKQLGRDGEKACGATGRGRLEWRVESPVTLY